MKRVCFILMIFLSTFIMAKNYNLGFKVGLTYSNTDSYSYPQQYNNISDENSYYWGTFFSAYINAKINSLFSIQVEANFNQKGFKYEREEKDDVNVTLQMFEIVSLFKIELEYIRPYLGVFQSKTLYYKYIDIGTDGNEEETDDLGYVVGLEFYYKKYLIDFRYNQGFNNVWGVLDSEHWFYYDNARQFVLSFGYEF